MALTDILSSLLNPQQTANAFQPGQSAVPADTPLSELIVPAKSQQRAVNPQLDTMPPSPGPLAAGPSFNPAPPQPNEAAAPTDQSPQASGLNYNNSTQASAVNQALQGEHPQGGMANSGIYGLLPQNLQHGTLRNVLGALGDALLVSGGRQPVYEQRMQNQEIGQAMAGMDINDPQSVAAATQRVAATGAAGSPEMADKLQQQAEQAAQRRQLMEYNNNSREQMVGVRQNAQQAQAAAVADRYRPQIGGMLSGVKDAATYETKYNSLSALAHQIGGSDATPASLWSLPEPGAWTPELTSGYGMTANNQQQTADRAAGRAQTQTNATIAANSRIAGAGIGAGAHVQAATIGANKPTEGTLMAGLIAKQNSNQTLTPAEQTYFSARTQTHGGGRGLAPGLTVGAGGAAAPHAAPSKFIEGHVYTDAHGNHATYQNGKFVPH